MTTFNVTPLASGYLDLDVPVGATSVRIINCPKEGKLKAGCIPSTVTQLRFDSSVNFSHIEPGVIGESVTHLAIEGKEIPPIPVTVKHLFLLNDIKSDTSPAPSVNIYVHLSRANAGQSWTEKAGIYWNGNSLPPHTWDHSKYTYGPEQKATFGPGNTVCFATRTLNAKPVAADMAPLITDTKLDDLLTGSKSSDPQTVAGWILEALTIASNNGTLHEGFQFTRSIPTSMNVPAIKANIQRCIKTNRLAVTVVDGADGTHSIEAKLTRLE